MMGSLKYPVLQKSRELIEMVKLKYKQSDKLINRIDWKNIMKMPRCAGGHDEQMRGLLKNVTVLGHWNEGDYQGYVATCVQLNDTGEIVIYNDLYGSCSGCDQWEDATDDDVRQMCRQLVCGAYVFKNLDDCKEFLGDPDRERSFDWAYDDVGLYLLNAINNHEV